MIREREREGRERWHLIEKAERDKGERETEMERETRMRETRQ